MSPFFHFWRSNSLSLQVMWVTIKNVDRFCRFDVYWTKTNQMLSNLCIKSKLDKLWGHIVVPVMLHDYGGLFFSTNSDFLIPISVQPAMHSCISSPLAHDPIRVQSCVCCLFWINRNCMAVTSIIILLSYYPIRVLNPSCNNPWELHLSSYGLYSCFYYKLIGIFLTCKLQIIFFWMENWK